MSSNETILSVCIPTYNRSAMLAQAVHAVYDAIAQVKDHRIEVIISDNTSTDDTEEIARMLVKQYPGLRYNRNPENVRDENFFIAASLGSGKYVWVLADDDVVEKNAMQVVTEQLQADPSLVILNYSFWNQDMTRQVRASRYKFKGNLNLTDPDEVLRMFGPGLQFISGVIIKKTVFFSGRSYDYKLLHDYGNSFEYAVYNGLQHECNCVYVHEPRILRYRMFNSHLSQLERWYKIFAEGNNFLFNLLEKQGYSATAVRAAKYFLVKDYIVRDLFNRKYEEADFKRVRKHIPNDLFRFPLLKMVYATLLLMPLPLYKMMHKKLKSLSKSIS